MLQIIPGTMVPVLGSGINLKLIIFIVVIVNKGPYHCFILELERRRMFRP